jgi:hypothetical protein
MTPQEILANISLSIDGDDTPRFLPLPEDKLDSMTRIMIGALKSGMVNDAGEGALVLFPNTDAKGRLRLQAAGQQGFSLHLADTVFRWTPPFAEDANLELLK